MKFLLKIMAAVILLPAFSCSEPHLITDPAYRDLVGKQFAERKELAEARSVPLFSVFNERLAVRESEALEYLYAFMPLSDLADYDGNLFLGLVRASLRARDEAPWGKTVPEDIFLHYVLPYRVNNENIDSFRIAYYDEIMERVKGKSMMDAALEINHWCHEKVSYQAADIRTSAPMSTILSARGRCGEESTFTVAALRTAGIPARQVYTPRWAHTDDNHAWVEVWSDGQWYYIGACEPEPVTDRGWFTEPARRAMLIHTKCFGVQTGENAISRTKYFTEVNHLSKYALTKKIFVKVTGADGRTVPGARVEYQLYNYAEFYPIALVPADSAGISSFETGLGDLLVWATDGKNFSYRKIAVAETDTLNLQLVRVPGEEYTETLDLQVPLALTPLPGPSAELVAANAKRIEEENSIRQKYIDSWIKPAEIRALASQLGIDTTELKTVFGRSMGNYREIRNFLSSAPDSLRRLAMAMLSVLADKDLRDTKAAVLSDHLLNCPPYTCTEGVDEGINTDYVVNPRVANEMLKGWRSWFLKELPEDLREKAAGNPELIRTWLENTVKIDNQGNYYKTPLSPLGTDQLKVSDSFSRDICFVAICRTLGIPARLEPGSLLPQYFLDREWHDLYFTGKEKPGGSRGFIRLVSKERKPEPEYYTHFTLARFENGKYVTLDYDYNIKVSEFSAELPLVPGNYMLVTGNRLPDSRILAGLTFFNLAENEHRTLEISPRKDPSARPFLGKIDLAPLISRFDKLSEKKGVVVLWVEPEKEPSRHVFNDVAALKNEFDDWGGWFIFLADPASGWQGFSEDELKKMPANTICGSDSELLAAMGREVPAGETRLPLVVLAAPDGKILYRSSGYRIGTGEQILRYTP